MDDRHFTAHIMPDHTHLGADHNVFYRPQVLSDAQTELSRQLVGQTPALRRWLLSKKLAEPLGSSFNTGFELRHSTYLRHANDESGLRQ